MTSKSHLSVVIAALTLTAIPLVACASDGTDEFVHGQSAASLSATGQSPEARNTGARGPKGDPAARFAAQDKNQDGALTEDEVPQPRWDRMKQADANSDGKLTQDELRAAHESGVLGPRGQRGQRGGGPGRAAR